MIKQLTKREQLIFVLCVSLGVVYSVMNFVIKPIKSYNLELDGKISTLKRQAVKNRSIIQKGEAVAQEYQLILDRFNQKQSSEQITSGMLSEIEKVASSLQMKISDLKPKSVEKNKYYNQFPLTLKLSAEFSEIVQFLYILQNEPYLFKVEDFRISSGGKNKKICVKNAGFLSKIMIPLE